MFDFFRRMKVHLGITAVVLILIGLALMLRPGLSARLLCRGIGLLILVYGLSQGMSYFTLKKKIVVSPGMLAVSIVMTVIGLWMSYKGERLISFFPIVAGVMLLFSGVQNVMQGFSIRGQGYDGWQTALILGAITALLGLILIWNPFTAATMTIRVIGAFLIYSGASDLWIGLKL